jgi:hypothetical protein
VFHLSRSTSSRLGLRWSPVAPRTASKPRHIVVVTVELRSLNEPVKSRETSRDSSLSPRSSLPSPIQFASTSSSAAADEEEIGTGRDAEGESFRVSAACVWNASVLSCENSARCDGDELRWFWFRCDCEKERTTSPLQIGHVRRRVTSQGVLQMLVSGRLGEVGTPTCSPRGIHDHMVNS